MCGLVGIAGHLIQKDQDILIDLLKVSAPFRGEDSTGVFSVDRHSKQNAVRMLKQVGPPYELINTVGFQAVSNAMTSRGLFGHVRKKTVGEVNRYTAHPFHEGDIIGMHNGTLLHGWRTLTTEDYPVDSQAIMAALSQTDDPKSVLEKLNGAFALIWFDQRTGYLYIARNEQRPLWYCFSKDLTRIFWASEYEFLELVLDKNNQDIWGNEKGQGFFPVAPMEMNVLDLRIEGKDRRAIQRVESVPFVKPTPAVTTWQGGTTDYGANQRRLAAENKLRQSQAASDTAGKVGVPSNPFVGGVVVQPPTPNSLTKSATAPTDLTSSTNENSPASSNTPAYRQNSSGSGSERPKLSLVNHADRSDRGDNVLYLNLADKLNDDISDVGVFDTEVLGPKGLILNRTQFESITDDGCQWCQSSISFEDEKAGKGVHKWLDAGKFICKSCSGVSDALAC